MMPKINSILIASLALANALPLFAQEHDHNHDHGATAKQENHAGHDHGHGHEHESDKKVGPNSGKVITSVTPNFELFVQDDRKVRITFLDEEGKAIAPAEQKINGIGGSRSDPTRMQFEQQGDVLVSDLAVPEGSTVPLIIRIQPSPDAQWITERISINMAQCPTCDYKEYACVCGHDE